MDRINEIGDTKKGQEMLGRTAERAYQRAQRTSGADKNRYMRTYNDAYKTGGKSSNKHLGGSREHFDNGRDYEYEKWADEHNGNVAESKTMNKKLIRLTESDLHKIVKESVNRVLKEANFRGERLHGNNPEDWEALTSLRNNLDTYGEYSPGSMTPKEKEKHHKAWKRNYRNFDSLTDKIDDELGQKPLSPEYDERYQKYADQSSKKYHNMRKNLGLPEFYH